jgi:hypothetical protein
VISVKGGKAGGRREPHSPRPGWDILNCDRRMEVKAALALAYDLAALKRAMRK